MWIPFGLQFDVQLELRGKQGSSVSYIHNRTPFGCSCRNYSYSCNSLSCIQRVSTSGDRPGHKKSMMAMCTATGPSFLSPQHCWCSGSRATTWRPPQLFVCRLRLPLLTIDTTYLLETLQSWEFFTDLAEEGEHQLVNWKMQTIHLG